MRRKGTAHGGKRKPETGDRKINDCRYIEHNTTMDGKEIPVTFLNGKENLFGILHHPLNAELNEIPVIIFLHGSAGYRIGPHQLFVRMARFLARQGYACLRFDFRGKGYSEGIRENTSYRTMLSDLDTVIQSVNSIYKPTRIILVGICSGARTALSYIKNGKQTVHSLIELSSPLLWQTNEVSTATSRTKGMITDYTRKAMNLDNWKRLFTGEVNYKMIGRIIKNNLAGQWLAIKNSLRRKKERDGHNQTLNNKPFHNFKGEVLLIHGEKDPEAGTAMKQIKSLLQKHQIGYHDLMIKNANHSFYSLKWEKEIMDTVYNWMKNRFLNNYSMITSMIF
ncbi:MAG: alpha/beta hydrolase [Mangrovibacterium sp.]